MKIKDIKDLRTKDEKSFLALIYQKKLELIKNAVKITEAKEKNVKLQKKLKKEIAQVLTILNEKKLDK